MVEQLAGMLSSSERPLQTPIELLDLPEQVCSIGSVNPLPTIAVYVKLPKYPYWVHRREWAHP